jgi:hypothetical protein
VIFVPISLEVYKRDPEKESGINNVKDAGYLFFTLAMFAIIMFIYYFYCLATEIWMIPYMKKHYS